jgi:hypothetical protein
MPVGTALRMGYDFLTGSLSYVGGFMKWFYLDFLPFIIQYIAIPLFVLGILMALAFAGGTLLFTIMFFIFIYFFIKHTIFIS